MKWFGEKKALSVNQVIDRLEAVYSTKSGVDVTPDNAMRSPTVHAIVTAISRRIAVSPIRVMQKRRREGRELKEELPDHPVARLLAFPNNWQNRTSYWLDMGSQLVRYNNCFSLMVRANPQRPVRRLLPLHAGQTSVEFGTNNELLYKSVLPGQSAPQQFFEREVFHARGGARNFLVGDSPIADVREAIAMEIAAEQYGATFFGNGAIPLLVFMFQEGFKGFEREEEAQTFIDSVKEKLGGERRHKAFLLPKGIELADSAKTSVDHQKAQMVEARKYQRTVIAGAFGVPPHLVGDLERATFNNVEQQDSDFTINVVLPYVRILEASLERALLSRDEQNAGVVIRFNLDAIQRADFKSRQEGLEIQRRNGIINANDWRERESMNPIDEDDAGESYWRPSNTEVAGEDDETDEAPPGPAPNDDDEGENEPAND